MADLCPRCSLVHAQGELFVRVGTDQYDWPMLEETCEFLPTWRMAHAQPQPPGSVAYHATPVPDLVMQAGIDPAYGMFRKCKHSCIASTPGIAAETMRIAGIEDFEVFRLDVSEIHLFFELGEAGHHGPSPQ